MARKALLARVAASACSLASIRARSPAFLVAGRLGHFGDPELLGLVLVRDAVFDLVGRAVLLEAIPGLGHPLAIPLIHELVHLSGEVGLDQG